MGWPNVCPSPRDTSENKGLITKHRDPLSTVDTSETLNSNYGLKFIANEVMEILQTDEMKQKLPPMRSLHYNRFTRAMMQNRGAIQRAMGMTMAKDLFGE